MGPGHSSFRPLADVCFGSLADMAAGPRDVRFWGKADMAKRPPCRLMTQSGHWVRPGQAALVSGSLQSFLDTPDQVVGIDWLD